MKTRKWSEIKEKMNPDRRARLDAEIRKEMNNVNKTIFPTHEHVEKARANNPNCDKQRCISVVPCESCAKVAWQLANPGIESPWIERKNGV